MTDYQEENDDAHVIRVDSAFPPGVVPFLDDDEWTAVAGISRCEDGARAFVASRTRHVLLEREPSNQYDPNAVLVFGLWRGHDGYGTGGRLGYLPREVAAELAARAAGLHLHARIAALYAPRPGMGCGVRLVVGVSRLVDPLTVDTGLETPPTVAAPPVLHEPHSRPTRPMRGRSPSTAGWLLLVLLVLALAVFLGLRR